MGTARVLGGVSRVRHPPPSSGMVWLPLSGNARVGCERRPDTTEAGKEGSHLGTVSGPPPGPPPSPPPKKPKAIGAEGPEGDVDGPVRGVLPEPHRRLDPRRCVCGCVGGLVMVDFVHSFDADVIFRFSPFSVCFPPIPIVKYDRLLAYERLHGSHSGRERFTLAPLQTARGGGESQGGAGARW